VNVGSIRSGLAEAIHPVSVIAVDADGTVLGSLGDDLDREFFYRSAVKPLQATVSQRNGADLTPERLAITAASHWGLPLHIAYVEDMLSEVDLHPETHLVCPPDRPTNRDADRVFASQGRTERERIFHNCSGKHSGMLRACAANGWSLDYADPDHPLQRQITELASDAVGRSVEPTGVDGCGIPTLRGDVLGLARVFSRLVNDPQFDEASRAASRFTAHTTSGDSLEAHLTRWIPAVAKGGAEGCLGLGMFETGVAVAAKAWTGSHAAAAVGMVELMDRMGLIPEYQRSQLDVVARPVVLGGGVPVGRLEPLET
jgi:L-asparaginase II